MSRAFFGYKSGQEVYSYFSNSNCEYSWDELEGLRFIHRSGGVGSIIRIIGDIDDDWELQVTFKNSKFNTDVIGYGNVGKNFPLQTLNNGSFTKIFLDNSLFVQINNSKIIFKEKQDKKKEEERILREKNSKIIKQLTSEINTKFQKDFLSTDSFYKNECSEYITNEEYDDLKIVFIKSWAGKNSLLPLDDDQARAIGECAGDIQLIARAGSGKTKTVVNRAIFLQKHCRVSPDQILILAFNTAAAKEIRKRFKEFEEKPPYIKNPPYILTFHAFAYSIVRPREELLLNDQKEKQFKLDNVFNKFLFERLKDRHFEKQIKELMLEHFKKDWIKIIEGRYGKKMLEFINYHRFLKQRSFKGHTVRSEGEKIIANFFFENDISYYYEYPFDWNGRPYRPDFVIFTKKESKSIVIEYFGMTGQAGYDAQSEEKRKYWDRRKKDFIFLEYSEEDKNKNGVNGFKKKLEEDLKNSGVLCRKLSEEQIWDKIQNDLRLAFTQAATNFVGKCRKSFISPEGLYKLISEYEALADTEFDFLKIVNDLYVGYLKYLKENNQDDFDGLMHRAVEKIEGGEKNFEVSYEEVRITGDIGKLRYICIDEFQDFNEMFFRLKQAIRDKNNKIAFYCVGDDWQAINTFAGSDLKYFKQFDKYFHPVKQALVIPNNYRSHKDVVNLGNNIMENIGGVPAKHTQSLKGGVYKVDLSRFIPTQIEKKRHEGDYFTPAVLRLIDRIIRKDKQDVVLLSRTNNVPYSGEKIGAFETRLKKYIKPESLRGSIKVGTTHSYKGNEADNVIIIDATEARYPLLHPHWIFNQIFGDTLEKIYYEEQRLFYVAVTRAKYRLFLFTDKGFETPFLNDQNIRLVNWEQSPPIKLGNNLLVKILNKEQSKRESTIQIRKKLKATGYAWIQDDLSWQKTLVERDSFRISDLQKESWCEYADGIEININDEDDSVLAKYFLNEGKWEIEFDNI